MPHNLADAGKIAAEVLPILLVLGMFLKALSKGLARPSPFISPAGRACRRCPSGVHSRNSNCPTSRGFNQRHSLILSAVNPSPQRPLLASGRFTKGHSDDSRPLNRR
jgi:hypothetical protein